MNSITNEWPFENHRAQIGRKRILLVAAALVAFQGTALAAFPEVRFSAETVHHESVRLQQVSGALEPSGSFRFDVGHAEVAGQADGFSDVSVTGWLREASFAAERTLIRSDFQVGIFKAGIEYLQLPGEMSVAMKLADQDLSALKSLPGLPPQADWLKQGHLSTQLEYRETAGKTPELSLRMDLGGVGIDSPDGRYAADGLSLNVEFTAAPERWTEPVVQGVITGGEILIDDFYRNFSDGEFEFTLDASWGDHGISIREFSMTDHDTLSLEGKAGFDFGSNPDAWQLQISRVELKFPGAYERYLEPMAAASTLDGLGISGQLAWSGQWDAGDFSSGELTVTDLTIVDVRRNRFAFTGLDARMRPGDHTFNSRLNWRGLLLGKINLGPGELALDSEPGKFAIVQPLVLDVLGGRLKLDQLAVLLPGGGTGTGEPDIRLKADLDNLDMQQLTVAFGWPEFSGKISGHIPGVSLDDGVLDVEGKIVVSVFDGTVSLEDVRIERLFGVLPSLAANVEAVGLDLELLTRTFSFGQISGRVDGYIRDLRMLDWKPVAFDAWFGTPARQKGSRDISRKAVNHLTTLGGGGATTALTSPVMKLFSNFSYKSIGLGCHMQNNVCDIRGVSEDDVSVLIMEGAGVPKITIRAFNRRVDWPQLMAQLVAATEGESVKIGD